jgi:hypothetical protein
VRLHPLGLDFTTPPKGLVLLAGGAKK